MKFHTQFIFSRLMMCRLVGRASIFLTLLALPTTVALSQPTASTSADDQGDDAVLVQLTQLLRKRSDIKEQISRLEVQIPSVRKVSDLLAKAKQNVVTAEERGVPAILQSIQTRMGALLDFLRKFDADEPDSFNRMNTYLGSLEQKALYESIRTILEAPGLTLNNILFSPQQGFAAFSFFRFEQKATDPLDGTSFFDSQLFDNLPGPLQQKLRGIIEQEQKARSLPREFPSLTGCRLAFSNVRHGDADAVKLIKENIGNLETCAREIIPAHKYAADRTSAIGNLLQRVRDEVSNFQDDLIKQNLTADAALQDASKKLEEAERKAQRARGRTIIDGSAVTVIFYTLWAWGVIIAIVIGAILALAWLSLRRQPQQGDTENREITGPASYLMFLEMMTVFLLTGTILILGLSGRLNTEGLAALIGGIAGYVLGRMNRSSQVTS